MSSLSAAAASSHAPRASARLLPRYQHISAIAVPSDHRLPPPQSRAQPAPPYQCTKNPTDSVVPPSQAQYTTARSTQVEPSYRT
eukprot:1013145-Rhodomonas_salina.2